MPKSRLSQGKQDRLIEHFVAGTTSRIAAALAGMSHARIIRRRSITFQMNPAELYRDLREHSHDRMIADCM